MSHVGLDEITFEELDRITGYISIIIMNIANTYHKTISIFDEDIPDSAKSFEELLQISVPDAERQTADVNARTHHF